MGYRSDDKYIIYPFYFDAQISRRKGRRVSKKYAVEKPSIQTLFNIAKSLTACASGSENAYGPLYVSAQESGLEPILS